MSKKEIDRKYLHLSPGSVLPVLQSSRSGGFFYATFTPSFICGLLLVGCTSGSPDYNREHNLAHDRFRSFRTHVIDRTVAKPPIAQRSGSSPGAPMGGSGGYVVKRGDTLYSIAQNHGVDPTVLAAWNNIADPRAIYIGQQLFMAPPQLAEPSLFSIEDTPPPSDPVASPGPVTPLGIKPSSPTAGLKTEPQALKVPYSEQAVVQMKRQSASAPVMAIKADPILEKDTTMDIAPVPPSTQVIPGGDRLEWIWPAKGTVAELFSENTKGIDIAGTSGQAVTASAAGKVVYSGTGLRGYGKLIIIKHNDTYLSAYAHNSKLLVKEGQSVAKGQKIAEMGDTDSNTVKLHFEIRKNGKPVDPLKHLPGISG